MKRFVLTIILIGVVAFVGVLSFALWPTATRQIATIEPVDAALVEKGRYLAVAADCSACHTSPGGAAFAGDLAIASPIGTIYTPNITPDPTTGIGGYSLDDFDRAVRHGISPRGLTLYPAMPYPSYARMTDDDVVALYAYFTKDVAAVKHRRRAAEIPWPLSIRWPLAIWRKSFAPDVDAVAFDPKRYTDPTVARGAYLMQGPGHCGACHTPRGLALQEEALDESGTAYLSGGQVIDGWFAVNLRGDPADGLGGWTPDDIVATLRSARNTTHAVIGSAMSDVVVHSTQYMTDADLRAMAMYLKSLSPAATSPAAFTGDPTMASALASGQESSRGAQLYVDNCAACHRTDGKGIARIFPEIAGNSSVLAVDPTSMIRLILQGSQLPGTEAAPSNLGMPGFAWRLSDAEVAQLTTFIRQSWGNHAGAVDSGLVEVIRSTTVREREGAGRQR